MNGKRPFKISVRNSEFQILSALRTNRSKRSQEKEVFVEGTEGIKQLIEAGWEITRILFRDGVKLSHWGESILKKYSSAKQFEVSSDLFGELSEKENPSELMVTAKIRHYDFSDLKVEKKEKPFYLLFDRPSDLGNFGSILRSADAFQVDFVFVLGHSIDVYDPKVVRSSLGSLFHTKLIFVESISQWESFLKSEKERCGLQIVGTDSLGSSSLRNQNLKPPILIILGNEAKGMSVHLKSLCDFIVNIPMFGVVNSLNVSCAGSILLWEVTKNAKELE
ncbi:RNA methyltransferase [Leptospira sp. 2 VSF19]|uniref:RNA methyltransferase n=1 Tax=Leptospira soteropolitanensis TaxID=2950025 RepID=A0AAW5VCV3_9LEPT|nr:TrmH family RNA methyltransferase [Leptospira soteropolitanensis]MCW7493141.1 RNA methyltransferase [Leptospira soteropolitanensis]MCW7500790.1 RNA methyltransferase [Leptospira soteropolitanensis]MCW7522991.1 RNA methyltransferase [Leptospira soteropolitanensis]MCW7526902.1 RNA methyltransferase [Leptospira soteropolitanensis]MCW7530709.1 RNA methyltransferase [Leptospira soteropolitanensis]